MAKKVYAIKEGFDTQKNIKIEDKIVSTWAECLKLVKGVKGAKYKSFERLEEANKFLEESSASLKKGDNNYPKDCPHIYVDGSYNIKTKEYAYGMIAVVEEVVSHIESGKGISGDNTRQIKGELEGALRGAEYATSNSYKKIVIFHDYIGICNHATGLWERKEESSKKYYELMQGFMKEGLEIVFVKVDSHTGDLYNEMVDELCKNELNISSDKTVEKWLSSNIIKVKNEELKNKVEKLINNNKENIEINSFKDILKEEDNYCKFEEIISIYKSNNDSGLTKIKKLTEKEKVDLIKYLIE